MSKLYAKSESASMTLYEDGRVFVNHEEYFPASKPPSEVAPFVVGDFVRVIGKHKYDENFIGEDGKVIAVDPNNGVGVEFARYNSRRHTLDGRVNIGHGYWFKAENLAKEE